MKVYREWRISGDTEWLRALWPKVKQSLDYCIETWDPGAQGRGGGTASQHLRHRVLGAGRHVHQLLPRRACRPRRSWARRSATRCRSTPSCWPGARARPRRSCSTASTSSSRSSGRTCAPRSPLETKSMVGSYSPEARAMLEKEGPKYQYGTGCLSDGVLGSWLALVCGVGQVLATRQSGQPPAGRAPVQPEARPVRLTPIRSGRPTPAAPRAACCSAPGPRAASCRCRSSTPTRSGPASNTRWPRT